MKRTASILVLSALLLACDARWESGEGGFRLHVDRPAFPLARGPLVLVDGGHFNTHTLEGRYGALAEIARLDGYRVRSSSARFSRDSLARARILVIANALHERNRVREPWGPTDWSLPTPSAFAPDEIRAVRDWVHAGGGLLLASDHMPFAGAAADLAAAFGVELNNGFVLDERVEREVGDIAAAITRVTVFRRSDGGLADSPVANGRGGAERVDAVATFAGHALRVEGEAEPLLVLGPSMVSVMPAVSWEFPTDTPRVSAAGWLQGVALRFGEGRVAVLGEVGLFGVQKTGGTGEPVGMNAPDAAQNPQFLLNLLHWLSGLLDGDGET